jgi:hypothetical protein
LKEARELLDVGANRFGGRHGIRMGDARICALLKEAAIDFWPRSNPTSVRSSPSPGWTNRTQQSAPMMKELMDAVIHQQQQNTANSTRRPFSVTTSHESSYRDIYRKHGGLVEFQNHSSMLSSILYMLGLILSRCRSNEDVSRSIAIILVICSPLDLLRVFLFVVHSSYNYRYGMSKKSGQDTGPSADACTQLLNYCATHPDASIRRNARSMILHLHSGASYLSKAILPYNPPPPARNGAIHVLCSIMLPMVLSPATKPS